MSRESRHRSRQSRSLWLVFACLRPSAILPKIVTKKPRSPDRDKDTVRCIIAKSPKAAKKALARLKGTALICTTLNDVGKLADKLRDAGTEDVVIWLDFHPNYRDLDLVDTLIPAVLDDILYTLWGNQRQLYLVRPPWREPAML